MSESGIGDGVPVPLESGVRVSDGEWDDSYALMAAVVRWPDRWLYGTVEAAALRPDLYEDLDPDEMAVFLDDLEVRIDRHRVRRESGTMACGDGGAADSNVGASE